MNMAILPIYPLFSFVLLLVALQSKWSEGYDFFEYNRINEIPRQSAFFPNYCSTADGTDGICYGEVTCKRMYGKVSGYCGTYQGACCIFYRMCNGLTSQEVSYFGNTRWPSTQRLRGSCPVTVRKPNSHYCGLRLELSHLRLPNQVGSCSDTYLSVSGFPGKTYVICGKFREKIYEFDITQAGDIQIQMQSYSGYQTAWDIKIRQIMCHSFKEEKLPKNGDGGSGSLVKIKPVKQGKPIRPQNPTIISKPGKPTRPKPSKPTRPKPVKDNYGDCGKSRKLSFGHMVANKKEDTSKLKRFTANTAIAWNVPTLTDSYFYKYQDSLPQPFLTQRIVFGSVSEEGKYPWQIALFTREGRFHCGGTLLTNMHILTAAHCVVKKSPNSFMIVLGSFDLSTKDFNPKSVKRSLQSIWVHHQYSPYNLRNDVAVLKMSNAVRFTSEIRAACLPDRSKYLTKQIATVTGWGKTENGYLVNELHELRAEILDNNYCEKQWNPNYSTGNRNFIMDTMICLNPQDGDSCNGDSGGPLILERRESPGTYEVIGIVSFGSGSCKDKRLPGVYTRVSKYTDWIKTHLRY